MELYFIYMFRMFKGTYSIEFTTPPGKSCKLSWMRNVCRRLSLSEFVNYPVVYRLVMGEGRGILAGVNILHVQF